MAKPTITEIKLKTKEICPYYFSRETMKHFGQKMRDFSVRRSPRGDIYIVAPIYDDRGCRRTPMGFTFRRFTGDDLVVVRDDNGELLDTSSNGARQRIEDYLKNH